MPEPKLVREGNLRLMCVAGLGWPREPLRLVDEVRRLAIAQGGEPYGPAQIFVAGNPEEEPLEAWECHVGCAVTGMPRPGACTSAGQRVLIEDYRQLVAVTLPHHGPLRRLGDSWRSLAQRAAQQGQRLRPYWRVRLVRRQLADGNLLPLAEVSAFIDG
ncbi:MAG: hypothetical protein RMM29_06520 [Planctomycetota bacterium]|nr:hypothetical protein [Planctomycetota bacterium]MDW8373283.1 hypothetical protein [Planctomycetota bacterium]